MFTSSTKFFFFFLLLFFFNQKNSLAQNVDHWELLVAADDTWAYFLGTKEPPSDWTDLNFDDSPWLKGSGGIGYGDNDDGTTISQVSSVYLRRSFAVLDVSQISWALLHMDYDDAFVAYLNGYEIARANVNGNPPKYNAYANTYHEAAMYSGGQPEAFLIREDTVAKYLQTGNNVLAIQVHNYNATSTDLSSNAFLSLGITVADQLYRTVPAWFKDPFPDKSNLPLILIDTDGNTIQDEPKITARMKVIDNDVGNLNGYFDEATDYDSFIGIEIRGQSSQMFPKKSYGLETRDELGEGVDVSLLGMPEEEDWILSAPYSDKTMLRNALTYQLGAKMGSWQPRFKFCEVYINSVYQGVYMLTEKIKRGSDRVDVNKLKPDEISGDDLTGGYILKVDKIWDLTTDEYFYTYPSVRYYNARDYAFTYEYPKAEDIVSEQKQYIYDNLVEFQNTLNGSSFKDPVNGYGKYIDINSFVDFQIMNELANNVDGYRYSTFFYKKKDSDGGKLFAGPLWDFNLGYGNVDYSPINLATDQWLYPHYGPYEEYPMHWWARLMEDPVYKEALYQRWKELRSGSFQTYSIMTDISIMTNHLGAAIDRNFEKWPIIGEYVWPNYNWNNTSYAQEVDYLKNWIIARLNWMDANITSTTEIAIAFIENENIEVYPNPAKDRIQISLSIHDLQLVEIELTDMLGKRVYTATFMPIQKGSQHIPLNVSGLENGYYILKIKQAAVSLATQKVIIQK